MKKAKSFPRIVSQAEWQAARDKLLVSVEWDGRSRGSRYPRATSTMTSASRLYRTYFTNGRGVEALGTPWTLLDVTPYGRQETWEDSPKGWPQTAPLQWWRRHDEYGR